MGKPLLPDPKLSISAGINPKGGTNVPPLRASANLCKSGFKKIFRIIDEQDAVNRYKWYNLPCNLSSQELERLLYYKGQLVFFYYKELNEFYFMPFALDGTIDFYARYNTVHPVPMTSGMEKDKESGVNEKKIKEQIAVLSTIKLNVKKGVVPFQDLTEDDLEKSGVILRDYTNQYPQTIIPRQEINDPILDMMAEVVPFLRTSLIAGTGIKGMRVNDADSKGEVLDASKSILGAALNGELFTPITSAIEFQELNEGAVSKAQEYLMSLQALDNMRLGTYGIDNGGVFEKKAHKLQSEQNMNSSEVAPIYQDGLSIRQHFCNIVNSIWGLGIWCEPSESVLAVDIDGDGKSYDENVGQNSGEDDGGESDADL